MFWDLQSRLDSIFATKYLYDGFGKSVLMKTGWKGMMMGVWMKREFLRAKTIEGLFRDQLVQAVQKLKMVMTHILPLFYLHSSPQRNATEYAGPWICVFGA